MSKYAQDLSWEMQIRGVSESDIREAVSEVHEVERAGGDALDNFSPAKQYAESFTNQHSRSGSGRGPVITGES